MSMRPMLPALCLLISLPVPVGAAAAPFDLTGRWSLDGQGGVEVAFQPCGEAVCGLLETNPAIRADPDARDEKNPDPQLRARRLKGLATFTDFRRSNDGWSGKVYVPPTGATYSVTLRRPSASHMSATGCLLPFVCQTSGLTQVR